MCFYEKYIANWTKDSTWIINTPSITARQSFFYVQETGYFKTTPGYYTERSHHPSYLIIYTESGYGILETGGRTYKVPPESIMYIDCMQHHSYYPMNDDSWQFYWVHFYGATSGGYYHCYETGALPVIHNMSDSQIPEIMSNILALNQERHRQKELINSKLIMDLLTEIIAKTVIVFDPADTPPLIHKIIQYMERNFQSQITLDLLSQQFSISKYHLAREFKKYTGYSPLDYLIRYRISQAKEMLKKDDMSLSQIAEQVGIHNESHFCALFKDREGCTPKQYWRTWRNSRS